MSEEELNNLIDEYTKADDFDTKATMAIQICNEYLARCEYETCRKYAFLLRDYAKENDRLVAAFSALSFVSNSYAYQCANHEAIHTNQEMLELALKVDRPLLIAGAHQNLGTSYQQLGRYHESAKSTIEAIKYYEQCDPDYPTKDFVISNIASLYVNLGLLYSYLKKHDESVAWCRKAVKTYPKLNDVRNILNIGYCYYEYGDFSVALGCFKRALRNAKEQNDQAFYSTLYQSIAEVYLRKNQIEVAISYLDQAYETGHKYKMYNIFLICTLFGHIYTGTKEFELAKKYLDEAFTMTDYAPKSSLQKFYSIYSEYCNEMENYAEAYKYSKLCLEINNELYSEDLLLQTNFMSGQFEAEQTKKELEISRLKTVDLVNSQKIIEQKNEELMNITAIKDNILGIISHDLKNHIGAILSANDIFLSRYKNLADDNLIQKINYSGNKALDLVNDILYMNKVETDTSTLMLEEYNINELINSLLENFKIMAKQKNIIIKEEYYSSPIICELNIEKFRIVIDNICLNAIKFTEQNGEITINTKKRGNIAHIYIIDTGIGMNEDQVAKLFTQYHSSTHKGSPEEESNGLGLYIAKTMLDRLNGTIEVFSKQGFGSEFQIKIPCIV